jgi:hypothetical protein
MKYTVAHMAAMSSNTIGAPGNEKAGFSFTLFLLDYIS